MIPKKRIRLSAMQRVEVWRRWKGGESLQAIGRALGKNNVVIHLLLKRHGGIAPPIHRRSPSSLTLAEREDIVRVWVAYISRFHQTYVAVFNLGETEQDIDLKWPDMGLPAGSWGASDLWTPKQTNNSDGLSVFLPPHASALYRIWDHGAPGTR